MSDRRERLYLWMRRVVRNAAKAEAALLDEPLADFAERAISREIERNRRMRRVEPIEAQPQP